jgi:LPXTG-site transpeptidase (sortase) family protein
VDQRSESSRHAGVAVVVLLAAGAALLIGALLVRHPSPPGAAARGTRPPSPSAATRTQDAGPATSVADRIRGPALPRSAPTSLRVPRLGLDRPLVRLGVDPAGALEPPQHPEDVGWFTGSVTPGETGPAVLAGHVTWNGVPAVFFRLGAMRVGDRLEVDRADGRTATFEVVEVRRYAKSRFPTQRVYGAVDHAALRLITCGGRYDARRHRYADNVVVFADLVRGR